MASLKQMAANRRNAGKSTGPRTARGKAVSRLNGLKHGLSARIIVLPHEDQRLYEAQRHELFERLGPEGALEAELVERLAQLLWRLARAPLAETAVFADAFEKSEMADTWSQGVGSEAAGPEYAGSEGEGPRQTRTPETEVAQLRNALRFSADLHESYGLATDRLMRYEAHLERSFRRTLDLYLRLRAMRGVDPGPGPGALPEHLVDRIETARMARRQLIDGMRKAGAPPEELAAHEKREAAYARSAGEAAESEE